MEHEEITHQIIGLAMKVHRVLGSGFQEVIYQRCLEIEFKKEKMNFAREFEMPVMYEEIQVGTRRVDFLVENKVMVEIKAEKELGLNKDEVAFYYALAENESAVRELGVAILKKIAVEITKKLRNYTTVDWHKRESVRAKLRILVRRTLRRYNYPPDKQKAAMELVMKQAEVMADEWSK